MSCGNLRLVSHPLPFGLLTPAQYLDGMAGAEAATLDQEVTLKMKAVQDKAG